MNMNANKCGKKWITFSSTAPLSISWSIRRFSAAHTCDSQHNKAVSWCWFSLGKTPPVILVQRKKQIKFKWFRAHTHTPLADRLFGAKLVWFYFSIGLISYAYLFIAVEIRSQLATSLAYKIISASITDMWAFCKWIVRAKNGKGRMK